MIQALHDLYGAGLALWDLSTETLLLQIGSQLNVSRLEPTLKKEVSSGTTESQAPSNSYNFADLDSLRRNHFEVKIKDLAIKKRSRCHQKLVCVPDSLLKRGCNADVYSLGILCLQLILGFDL